MIKDLQSLPDDLPVPVDDGACDHLPGMRLPDIDLPAASGGVVNLANQPGTLAVYCYPMTGRPDGPPMPGWNQIPGARGCTPQTCGFRDAHAELLRYADAVYGISAQPRAEQLEAKQRLALPFELLNDSTFVFTDALRLPTFEYNRMRLIKRLSFIAVDGIIQKVFYPVFPPDQSATVLLNWFSENGSLLS